MKKTFEIEWDDGMGADWLSAGNILEILDDWCVRGEFAVREVNGCEDRRKNFKHREEVTKAVNICLKAGVDVRGQADDKWRPIKVNVVKKPKPIGPIGLWP